MLFGSAIRPDTAVYVVFVFVMETVTPSIGEAIYRNGIIADWTNAVLWSASLLAVLAALLAAFLGWNSAESTSGGDSCSGFIVSPFQRGLNCRSALDSSIARQTGVIFSPLGMKFPTVTSQAKYVVLIFVHLLRSFQIFNSRNFSFKRSTNPNVIRPPRVAAPRFAVNVPLIIFAINPNKNLHVHNNLRAVFRLAQVVGLDCDCDVVSRFDFGNFVKGSGEGVDFEGVRKGKAFGLNGDCVGEGELIEFECVHDCSFIDSLDYKPDVGLLSRVNRPPISVHIRSAACCV